MSMSTGTRDPLRTLMHYIATVSVFALFVLVHGVNVVQQAPDCDMALVHDDDLLCLDDAVCSSIC